jgi:hypothetical protein
MKRSTKILAGTVLFVMLVIVSHYVALFAMKRAGAYAEKSTEEGVNPLVVYPENVKIVKLVGFENVDLVMSDTFHFEYSNQRPDLDHVKWRTIGDTLFFQGDTTRYDTLRNGLIDTVYERAQSTLTIYTTGKEKLVLQNCNADIDPADKPVDMNLQLYSSSLASNWYHDTTEQYVYEVKMLRITAMESQISLQNQWQVHDMNIQLIQSSTFSDAAADVKGGTIRYDATSTITLTGYNVGRVRLARNVP